MENILSFMSIVFGILSALCAAGLLTRIPSFILLIDRGGYDTVINDMSKLSAKDPNFNEKIRDSVQHLSTSLKQKASESERESKTLQKLTVFSFVFIVISSVLQIMIIFISKKCP